MEDKQTTKDRLITIASREDIPFIYRDTPIGLLLEYHNLDRPYDVHKSAKLLVGMCMDNRKHLHMPDNFAFIIRSAGANLKYSAFKVSYAISVGKVAYIALMGHNNCGMVHLVDRKEAFIDGLVNIAGWERDKAEEHFMTFAPKYEIWNETEFILSEVKRLRIQYPKILIAPMLYRVENNKIYLLEED